MIKNELSIKTEKAIDEISSKFHDLKDKLSHSKSLEIDNRVQGVLEKLDDLNIEIEKQSKIIGRNRKKAAAKMNEVNDNIYSNMKSFNNAFRKAGSLFKRNTEKKEVE